ncbi:MAG TPA: AIR synthase-related protein, partial [Dehalococcoidia bacterium]|nr:AIR synthase-related protein [Dehalococcoidia bacterium]
GHTEITYRLDRPIVVAALLGEVERERLVSPEGTRPGDALILTKGIAIEGTAVLAREAGDSLSALGMSSEDVEEARRCLFEPGISVVREAAAACEAVRVHAMHDPTEGGLATALYEMAEASGCGISVDTAAVNVLPITRRLCKATGLQPLGLLASGALLLAVAEGDAEQAISAVRAVGISARRIGSIQPPGGSVIMSGDTNGRPFPRFARDEVARFFSERANGMEGPA